MDIDDQKELFDRSAKAWSIGDTVNYKSVKKWQKIKEDLVHKQFLKKRFIKEIEEHMAHIRI